MIVYGFLYEILKNVEMIVAVGRQSLRVPLSPQGKALTVRDFNELRNAVAVPGCDHNAFTWPVYTLVMVGVDTVFPSQQLSNAGTGNRFNFVSKYLHPLLGQEVVPVFLCINI